MFFGTAIGYIGGITNYLCWYRVPFPPVLNILVSIYVAAAAYAIVRHQLFDIEVIIKKTLVFAGLFAFVYAVFAGIAYVSQTLFQDVIGMSRWIAMIPSVLIVIFALKPLERFLINVTDKFLFQKKYDYKELLKTFTTEVLTIIDLEKLKKVTIDKLTDIMKITSCSVTLIDEDKDITDIGKLSKPTIGPELAIPMALNNKAIGLITLGKKKSDQDYTQDDLDILLPLSMTLGIAISNAKLFDELARTQAEIAQKEKMATIGTLAAGMAHEIRNPITTIKVFSEYLPDKITEKEFTDKYRNLVVKEVDRIDHIIQTMIDFSGSQTSEKERVDLGKTIDELVALEGLGENVECKTRFIRDIPADLAKIWVNKEELDEILLNITQNAIHSIEKDGVIKFTAREKGDFVELNIEDNGCGMSEEVLKNLFSPFYTTKSKGFGLGLFVVNELMKRNGGKISVESGAGVGTSFSLEFKKI